MRSHFLRESDAKPLPLAARLLIGAGTVIGAALTLYYILHIRTGITCAFHDLTGWYCPGCGTCRAIQAFAHGRFREMLSYNIMTVFLGIPAGIIFVHEYLRIVFPSLRLRAVFIPQRASAGITAALLLFWVLRNIPAFSFLAPG